jgi:hypothetical protein
MRARVALGDGEVFLARLRIGPDVELRLQMRIGALVEAERCGQLRIALDAVLEDFLEQSVELGVTGCRRSGGLGGRLGRGRNQGSGGGKRRGGQELTAVH